jgi:hypothetical protein
MSIVTWGRFIGDPYALMLVSCLMHVCRSLVIPTIISSNALSEYIVEQGRKVCADIQNAPRAPNKPVHDAVAERFWTDMVTIVSFLAAIKQCFPAHEPQFYSKHAADTFEFLSQAVNIVESPILSSKYKRLMRDVDAATFAANLYDMFPEKMLVSKERLHPAVADSLATISKEAGNIGLFVWQLIRHSRYAHICYALDCSESLQTSGRMYQRCGGCLVVGYSSKECQRRAWKDPRAPHKDICKKLRRVVDAGKGHFEGEECEAWRAFVQDVKKANITDNELCEVLMWLDNMNSLLFPTDGQQS